MKQVFNTAAQRLRKHRWPFHIVGLTGSIGMGKSTAACMLDDMGFPVFDADRAVHHLTKRGGIAVDAIATRFPNAVKDHAVDRQALGATVFEDTEALKDLEGILHPLVRQNRQAFFQSHAYLRTPCVVLDIPLLFESGGQVACDTTIVVSAPLFLQRQRVLHRPGMTEEKFAGILQRQTPDTVKRRLADHVIPSGLGKRETRRRLVSVLSVKNTNIEV